MQGQRLDKWLWFARLAKTRTLAAALVAAGKVRVNGRRADKPSRLLKTGDVVTGTRSGTLFVVRVLDGGSRRGPATLAASLYEDLTPPPKSNLPRPALPHGPRPTKRNRRRLDALRAGDC
jgi:ribosome-associated heat shock protein Hsp15